MGDPKKQRRKYETPLHPWRRDQLDVELKLQGEYGLRNKRELWRYKTMLSQIRGIARSLLAKSSEERERVEKEFLAKLTRLGLLPESTSIDDILDLDIRDLLERRLQTVVYRSGMALSPSQSRQLISHRHIQVGGRVVSVPGYLVPKQEEGKIKFAGTLAKHDHPVRKAITGRAPKEAPAPSLPATPGTAS